MKKRHDLRLQAGFFGLALVFLFISVAVDAWADHRPPSAEAAWSEPQQPLDASLFHRLQPVTITPTFTHTPPPSCGNYVIDAGEQCDPPNGTTCNYTCQSVSTTCGNGIVQSGEQCDPPNGTTCNSACQSIPIVCGNGIVQPGEQCDPPNGTTCNYACQTIQAVCGDYVVQLSEQCDPPNGTTCNSVCQIIALVCGNGIVQSGEQCDPPNRVTCDTACQRIPTVCGNNIVQPGERCDPPDNITCDAQCQRIPVTCGNGIVQSGEQCDPPDDLTCDSQCQAIVCGNSVVQSSEQCDPPDDEICSTTCETIGVWEQREIELADQPENNLTLRGTWENIESQFASGGEYAFSEDETASVTLTFTGEKFRLRYLVYWNFGIFDVYVDGEQLTTIDSYNATGDFMISDKFELDPGLHHLLIKNSGESNPDSKGTFLCLDAIDVLVTDRAEEVVRDYTPTPTPTSSPTITPTPTITPSPTATFTPSPTPVPDQNVALTAERGGLSEIAVAVPPDVLNQTMVLNIVCAYDSTRLSVVGAQWRGQPLRLEDEIALVPEVSFSWTNDLGEPLAEPALLVLSVSPQASGSMGLTCTVTALDSGGQPFVTFAANTTLDIPVPSSHVVITGSVQLEGRSGSSEAVIRVEGPDGVPQMFPVGTQGAFDLEVENMLPGSYRIVAESPGFLALAYQGELKSGDVLRLADGVLLAGDLTGDGVIDIGDVVQFGIEFNPRAASGSVLVADLSGDGVVDVLDLSLIGQNYLMRGALPWAGTAVATPPFPIHTLTPSPEPVQDNAAPDGEPAAGDSSAEQSEEPVTTGEPENLASPGEPSPTARVE